MRAEFTKRAVSDLRKVAADSENYGETVALAVEARLREVIAHIVAHPNAGAPVVERRGMRVAPLVRYPYRIFYRILEDGVRIVHISHASRRPWPSVSGTRR